MVPGEVGQAVGAAGAQDEAGWAAEAAAVLGEAGWAAVVELDEAGLAAVVVPDWEARKVAACSALVAGAEAWPVTAGSLVRAKRGAAADGAGEVGRAATGAKVDGAVSARAGPAGGAALLERSARGASGAPMERQAPQVQLASLEGLAGPGQASLGPRAQAGSPKPGHARTPLHRTGGSPRPRGAPRLLRWSGCWSGLVARCRWAPPTKRLGNFLAAVR